MLILYAVAVARAEQSPAERQIEAGHWKRARAVVETRLGEAPGDALSHFLLSQIRAAFGDRAAHFRNWLAGGNWRVSPARAPACR